MIEYNAKSLRCKSHTKRLITVSFEFRHWLTAQDTKFAHIRGNRLLAFFAHNNSIETVYSYDCCFQNKMNRKKKLKIDLDYLNSKFDTWAKFISNNNLKIIISNNIYYLINNMFQLRLCFFDQLKKFEVRYIVENNKL